MTIPALPPQGDTSWYDWATGMDTEARKVVDKLDTTAAAELIRDTIAAALVAGTGMTITVNDVGDTITLTSTGGYTDEQVRDVIATALVAGSNVTITPNDGADTITIAATGGGGGGGTPTVLNLARIMPVIVTSPTGGTIPTNIFNGITATTDWQSTGSGTQAMVFDLGQSVPITSVGWWLYYADGRVFSSVSVYGSLDGSTWDTLYAPASMAFTSAGLQVTVGADYRYIKTSSNGFNNEYVEVQINGNIVGA